MVGEYSSSGRQVFDQRGNSMAEARCDATATIISMALNTAFPYVRPATAKACLHREVDFTTLACAACGLTI